MIVLKAAYFLASDDEWEVEIHDNGVGSRTTRSFVSQRITQESSDVSLAQMNRCIVFAKEIGFFQIQDRRLSDCSVDGLQIIEVAIHHDSYSHQVVAYGAYYYANFLNDHEMKNLIRLWKMVAELVP